MIGILQILYSYCQSYFLRGKREGEEGREGGRVSMEGGKEGKEKGEREGRGEIVRNKTELSLFVLLSEHQTKATDISLLYTTAPGHWTPLQTHLKIGMRVPRLPQISN